MLYRLRERSLRIEWREGHHDGLAVLTDRRVPGRRLEPVQVGADVELRTGRDLDRER